MTVYGEMNDRYRPRPAVWRLTIVGFCHFVLGVTVANALVSLGDLLVWHAGKMTQRWIVYATPWQTLRPALPRIVMAYVATTETLLISGALLLLAAVIAFLWPGKQSLASRLFAPAFGGALAVFGGAVFPFRENAMLFDPLFYAAPAVGLLIAFFAEIAVINVLGFVLVLDSPLTRVALWLARVVPGAAAVAAASRLAGYDTGALAAAAYAVVTLLANLSRRPARRQELVAEPLMREATAALPVIVILLLAGIVWAFGWKPPRAVVLEARGPKRVELAQVARELEKEQPHILMKWGKRRD